MKNKKLVRNTIAVLSVVLMTTVMVLSSCGNAFDSEHANITIRLNGSGSGRAISDAEKSAATFNIYFNDSLVASNVSGTYNGTAVVGTTLKIRLDALVNGGRIARGEDTITVQAGSNSVAIKVTENREPVVGSIIMKDGSLRTKDTIGSDSADAIAVVYKVSGGKAWAVGKVLSSNGMAWATNNADGFNTNITALQDENGYTDGSTGLAKLIADCPDAATNLDNNYPAWDYACNYGIKQGLTNFQTGWYLPSKQEIQDVYNNQTAIEAALAQTGVSKTSFASSSYWWCSSQYASGDSAAYMFGFTNNTWVGRDKDTTSYYVFAVRQFTF